jgi:hypothetical protein
MIQGMNAVMNCAGEVCVPVEVETRSRLGWPEVGEKEGSSMLSHGLLKRVDRGREDHGLQA